MNKEVIKKYKAEFDHWLNGGKVYWYWYDEKKWVVLADTESWSFQEDFADDFICVVNDKHFEARKAYALGEEIEVKHIDEDWCDAEVIRTPEWMDDYEYRPKPKTKTILLETWLCKAGDGSYYTDEGTVKNANAIKLLSTREIEIEG